MYSLPLTFVAHRNRRSALTIAAGVLALCLAASIATAAPVHAQNAAAIAASASLNGDWTGALDVQGVQLHLVLHVKTEGGATTATLEFARPGRGGHPRLAHQPHGRQDDLCHRQH